MASTRQGGARLQIGHVVSGTTAALGRGLRDYLALTAIFVIAPGFLANLLLTSLAQRLATPADRLPLLLLTGSVQAVFAYPAIAAIVLGTLAYLDGKRLSFQDCLREGVRAWAPLFALDFMKGLIELAAALLLVVPALVLAVFWIVAAPVRLSERLGISASLSRSRALTKGNRWAIVVLILIFFAAALGLGFVISLMNVALSAAFAVTGLHVAPIIQAFSSAVSTGAGQILGAAGCASLYHELRTLREGRRSDLLVETFA
jgi:hypothetical protein